MFDQNVTHTNSLSRWKMSTTLMIIYAEILTQKNCRSNEGEIEPLVLSFDCLRL